VPSPNVSNSAIKRLVWNSFAGAVKLSLFTLMFNVIFVCTYRSISFYSPAGVVAKYCTEYVCLCVSLFVCPRGYLRKHTRDLYQIFVHVAYVCGSVLFRHVDDRPHRLSAGKGVTGVHSADKV